MGVLQSRRYRWRDESGEHELTLAFVPGTASAPYHFGHGAAQRAMEVSSFFIATAPVTQALWRHVMGTNPAVNPDPRCPVENVSWDHVTQPGGFLDRINASEILRLVAGGDSELRFRLPSEAEWEYAARGGPSWRDGLAFSGSDDPDVWEWCQDACTDIASMPGDGRPYLGPGTERRLRGGCHHNWDLHCTVSWRYGIQQDAHDGCIGFRVVLARPRAAATQPAARAAQRGGEVA